MTRSFSFVQPFSYISHRLQVFTIILVITVLIMNHNAILTIIFINQKFYHNATLPTPAISRDAGIFKALRSLDNVERVMLLPFSKREI